MINSGIYCIRHRESGKAYIGRSTDIRRRWNDHRQAAARGTRRYPLYAALKKYGADAFDWQVLVKAPEHLHVLLEECFMRDVGTLAPGGYNVGGPAGGALPSKLIALLDDHTQAVKKASMRDHSTRMSQTLAEKRCDPEYDAWYRERQRQSALDRWARRRERMQNDPAFAEEADARWRARAKKAHDTIKQRSAEDPAFAAEMREKRSRAARKARASDPRTLRAELRNSAKGGSR